ncbi:MAG TPA: RidA family protein [Candidatus Sulfotelmatobacter sp.]|nr:RidA family protein [Candidatus Sulfotelmatobacter sp.]
MKNIPAKVVQVCLLVALSLAPKSFAQSESHAGAPPQKSVSSSSTDAGSYIYISAQGPRGADGSLPPTYREQVLQALANLKTIVQSSGLSIDHVVYIQVYLQDMSHFNEMDKIFGEFFGKTPPARAVLGVARVPDPPVQINAVAVRDLADRRAIYPANFKMKDSAAPGILTHDRLFISSMPGSAPESGSVPAEPAAQVDLALDRMQSVLQAAGLDFRNMVFVNPYLTTEIPSRVMNERYARRFEFGNTPARATIQVSSLPGGAHIEYAGVAVRDLSLRKAVRPKNMPPSPTASPCVFAGDTLYCSAKDGFIPGPHAGIYTDTTGHQLRQTMRNQLDNLEEADMNFDQVVDTTVYLDNLSDVPAFDAVYAQYFGSRLPSRTTVQQIAPTERKADKNDEYPALEQMSLIAVRKPKAR